MRCLECHYASPNVIGRFCPNCGSDKFRNLDAEPVDNPVDNFPQPVDNPVDNFSKSGSIK